MTEQNSILVLDDDPDVREMLTDYFTAQGYEVIALGTGEAMREALGERVPDVVLLDVGLPGEDGLSLARYVREHFDVGIIMVSGAGDTLDRIIGLEVGADDYVVKPYSVSELMARVRTQLRRVRPATVGQVLTYDDIVLDAETHRVTRADTPLKLGPTEFRLLTTFMEKPGRVWSRDALLDRVWGRDIYVDTRTVDVHVGRLRKALTQNGGSDPLRTVRGAGYALG